MCGATPVQPRACPVCSDVAPAPSAAVAVAVFSTATQQRCNSTRGRAEDGRGSSGSAGAAAGLVAPLGISARSKPVVPVAGRAAGGAGGLGGSRPPTSSHYDRGGSLAKRPPHIAGRSAVNHRRPTAERQARSGLPFVFS